MQQPQLRAWRLIDQLRERLRYAHYSLRTEKPYVYWARDFIRFPDSTFAIAVSELAFCLSSYRALPRD